MVVKYFYAKGLIINSFAQNLLTWKNSGFSIKNSFRIYGSEQKKMEAIGQYLTRAPISLQKLEYIKSKGKVIIHTKYNEYFKENLQLLKTEDFISLLVQHISPARLHYIRYYGLYSSRSKGKGKDLPYVLRLAPEGWEKEKNDPIDDSAYEDNSVSAKAKRSAWARKQDIDLTHYGIVQIESKTFFISDDNIVIEYIVAQGAKASPELKEAIDRIREQIVKQEEKRKRIVNMLSGLSK